MQRRSSSAIVPVRHRGRGRGPVTPKFTVEVCGLCAGPFLTRRNDDDDDYDYAEGDEPVASQCRADLAHVFHARCIAEWTRSGWTTCPTCNVDPQLVIRRRAVAQKVAARVHFEQTSLRYAHVRAARRAKRECLAPLYRWLWMASRRRRLCVMALMFVVACWFVMSVASVLVMIKKDGAGTSRPWHHIKVYDPLFHQISSSLGHYHGSWEIFNQSTAIISSIVVASNVGVRV